MYEELQSDDMSVRFAALQEIIQKVKSGKIPSETYHTKEEFIEAIKIHK